MEKEINKSEREIILHSPRKDYVILLPFEKKDERVMDYLKKARTKVFSGKNKIKVYENTSLYLPGYSKETKPVAQYSRFEFNLDNIYFVTDNAPDLDSLKTDEVSQREAERSKIVQRFELVTEVISDEFYVIVADIQIPGGGELPEPKGNLGFLNTTMTTIFRVRYQNGESKKHYSILYKNKDFVAVNYKIIELAVPF